MTPGKKPARHRVPHEVHTLVVPCAHATRKRPHQITLAVSEDRVLLHLSTTCHGPEAEAVRRLGGVTCSVWYRRLHRIARRQKAWESTKDKELISPLRAVFPNLSFVRRRPWDHQPYMERTFEAGELRLHLLTKWASKAAGFGVTVTENTVSAHKVALATRVDGRWRFDEVYRLENGLHFGTGKVCPVCRNPNLKLNSRGASQHLRGKAHRENCVLAVRRLVRFLNKLGDKT